MGHFFGYTCMVCGHVMRGAFSRVDKRDFELVNMYRKLLDGTYLTEEDEYDPELGWINSSKEKYERMGLYRVFSEEEKEELKREYEDAQAILQEKLANKSDPTPKVCEKCNSVDLKMTEYYITY